jgi:hypothetical protein
MSVQETENISRNLAAAARDKEHDALRFQELAESRVSAHS